MRITKMFGNKSKNAEYMRYEYNHYHVGRTIDNAYVNASDAKRRAYFDIKYDYQTNNGLHAVQVGRHFKSLQYNYDLRVCGASSHFFSTIASFTDTETGVVYLVKETHCNTYICEL